MRFQWHPDDPPPTLEPHSRAKLEVLRTYLRAYFDKLNANPAREEFKLDLVDGFAGGGVFLDGNSEVSGSPLVMLEETEQAQIRLNQKRKKLLHINCRFYFVDKKKAHTDHLRKALLERGHPVDDDRIVVQNGCFSDEIKGILASIRTRQPRVGRAIFLLDQTGFSQVELSLVSRIFRQLPSAEVILTFAVDALVNLLSENHQMIRLRSPLQLTTSQIYELIQQKGGDAGRALIQRTLRDHIRNVVGAAYDTPFFIRPWQSRRALWFLHLSRHPTARDVMIQQHWDIRNTFEHYGRGDLDLDFGMPGWDEMRDSETLPLFRFEEIDQQGMRRMLLESLPRELFALLSNGPITINAFRHAFSNRTTARFSDLDEVMVDLVKEKEIEIIGLDGKPRSRLYSRLIPTDRLVLAHQQLIPGLSRRS